MAVYLNQLVHDNDQDDDDYDHELIISAATVISYRKTRKYM